MGIFPLPLTLIKEEFIVAKKDFDKVECQYCGKEFSKAGIANHEKACSKNPENVVEDTIVEPVLEIKEVVNEVPAVKETEMCDIKLKDKVDCYIGDRYYRFKKGEEAQVPVEVKNILKRAGLLEAI